MTVPSAGEYFGAASSAAASSGIVACRYLSYENTLARDLRQNAKQMSINCGTRTTSEADGSVFQL